MGSPERIEILEFALVVAFILVTFKLNCSAAKITVLSVSLLLVMAWWPKPPLLRAYSAGRNGRPERCRPACCEARSAKASALGFGAKANGPRRAAVGLNQVA